MSRRSNLTVFGLVLAVLATAKDARADYLVLGPVTAFQCHGFIIESCRSRRVDALRGLDGRLYEMNRRLKRVDEYDGSRCHIRVRWTNTATYMERQPDGTYEALTGVESITFKCRKM